MPSAAETPAVRHGRHDSAERRRATRPKGYTGIRVYIPAEALQAAGWTPGGPLPYYRTTGTYDGSRGMVLIRLYREK